jgi:LuxR family maltose regulon positive regulatory protein
VARPRLFKKLDAGLAGKLIILSAPAGFGKTTLITDWIHTARSTTPRPQFSWLTLDEGDNDPVRFIAYLTAALNSSHPKPNHLATPMSRPNLSTPITVVIKMLINEMAALRAENVLVLDDYHLIEASAVHEALDYLLDHLPPQIHIIITTRIDPPLSIARLRGRAQVMELRQEDLRLTLDETAAFLNQVMDLDLEAVDVAALASRTEGWIAGLQMAAVSMQGRADLPAFVRAFTGSNRYILDYLVEEVFQRQPEHVKTFLLHTAVLDRLSAPLCQYLLSGIGLGAWQRPQTSIQDQQSQALLEYLERSNLFITPLDEERSWYRYHRLFADLLRKRLQQLQPNNVPELHCRASSWFEQNNFLDDAVRHAFSAGDLDHAADLIEQHAETVLKRSESVTFLKRVDSLPDELVRTRPSLCVFHAWAMLLHGRPANQVESRLQDALSYDEKKMAPALSGNVAAIRSRINILQGQMARANEYARLALKLLPQENAFFRGIALWDLGMGSLVTGDIVDGSRLLEDAARTSREAGNIFVAVTTLCRLAGLQMLQGQLYQARDLYQQALELATRDRDPLPVASEALFGLGELAREWNDLQAATRYLDEGIHLGKQYWEMSALAGFLSLARIKQAQGDENGAQELLWQARKVAAEHSATEVDNRTVALAQAQIWIRQGNIVAAERWAEELGLVKDSVSVEFLEPTLADGSYRPEQHLHKYELVVLARLLLAQEHFVQALHLLDALLSLAEGRGRRKAVLEILILQALIYQAQGFASRATAVLEQALNLAQPAGYVRVFLDEGLPLETLLRRAAAREVAPVYARKLLAAYAEPQEELHPSGQPLADPLSERELEVLRLLATNASGPEIANNLVIAISTFRSHTKSIYGKLDVNRRSDAVTRARQLGLI